MAVLTKTVLRQLPASVVVFLFRDRRGNLIKLLHCDGQGFVCITEPWGGDNSSGSHDAGGSPIEPVAQAMDRSGACLWKVVDAKNDLSSMRRVWVHFDNLIHEVASSHLR